MWANGVVVSWALPTRSTGVRFPVSSIFFPLEKIYFVSDDSDRLVRARVTVAGSGVPLLDTNRISTAIDAGGQPYWLKGRTVKKVSWNDIQAFSGTRPFSSARTASFCNIRTN